MRLISILSAVCAGLSLIPASATAQSYTPLWQPSSSHTLYAYCTDNNGNIVPYCYMVFSTSYYAGTNAHTHYYPTAPLSTVNPTSGMGNGYGYLAVTVTTTIVGHAEWVANCPSCYNCRCGTYDYAVGYPGIYWVSDHGLVVQNGATSLHGPTVAYNHWMTSNAAYAYYFTTLDYHNAYGGTIYSNDMALPFAGKFDLSGTWTAGEDHLSHEFGTAADTDSVPQANVSAFLGYCTYYLAVDARQEPNGSLHCRWPN